MRTKFRPSHADYTYQAKYGIRAWQGGGRASARETVGRVAAGVLARKALAAAGAASRSSPGCSGCRTSRSTSTPPRSRARRSTPTSSAAPTPTDGGADDRAHRRARARRATRWAASSRRSRAACRPGWASRCSTSWTPIWPRRCCRCPPPRGSRSAAASPAPTSPAASTTTRSTTGRPRPHAHQPLRRRAGRHLQRRGDRHPRGVQADGDDPARAGDGRRERARHDDQGARAATIPACCRAPCRSSRRWWRWCWPIISCVSEASADRPPIGRHVVGPMLMVRSAHRRAFRRRPPGAGARCAGRQRRMPRPDDGAFRALRRVDAGAAADDAGAARGPLHYTAPDAVTFDWRGDGTTAPLLGQEPAAADGECAPATPMPISGAGPFQEAVVDRLLPGLEYQLRGRPPAQASGACLPRAPGAGRVGVRVRRGG